MPGGIRAGAVAVFAGCLLQAHEAFSQTVYSQATTPGYATGENTVDKSAVGAPNDLASFTNAVAAAFGVNNGGVFNFPSGSVTAGTTVLRGTFGVDGSKQIDLTSSQAVQSVANNGSFTQISDPIGIAQNADSPGYMLTIGSVVDTATGEPLPTQGVTQIGFTILSRTHATYPTDIRATAIFGDGSTESLTSIVGNPKGTDDTFFAFTAPEGTVIRSVDLRSFLSDTDEPVNTRIAFDDFGFIVSAASPPPVIQNVQPANYAIHPPTNGIRFEITAGQPVPAEGISLLLNGQDVTGQLDISGPETNRTVTFSGLSADTDYTMVLRASNSSGVTSLTNTFYTATQPFVLYDSGGFTDETLYPPGPLQPVTHDRAAWFPHESEPGNIVLLEEPWANVLEKINSGASRADWLHFPPISSGTLIVEFDASVSTTSGRTLDLSLSPPGTADMASFVALGGVPEQIAWYDNTAWQPAGTLQTGWHRYKIVNYLSGPSAGFFDLYIDEQPAGLKLRWRNPIAGAPLARLRVHTQDVNPILETAWLDNLILTAAPEDPNAFPPPSIANFLPVDGAMIAPSEGFSFEVISGLPIATNDIRVVLNSVDISSDLVIGGTETERTVSYSSLPEGLHTVEITVTNAGGSSSVTQRFIAALGPVVLFDSGGFEDDAIYPEGPLQDIEHGGSLWDPADGDPAEIVQVEEDHAQALRRTQVGVDRIDLLRFPPVSSGILTIEVDARVSTPSARTLDFCLIHATSTSMASFISWGTVPDQFAYYDGTAWIGVTTPGTDWHRYTLVNYLSGPNAGTFDLKVDGETVGENLPFRHAFPPGTAVGTIRIGAIRGEIPGEYGEIDNLTITIQPLASPPAGILLLNPERSDDSFRFTFDSQEGMVHTVEYKTDLSAAEWTTLETIEGDGSSKLVTDAAPGTPARYYRVRNQ